MAKSKRKTVTSDAEEFIPPTTKRRQSNEKKSDDKKITNERLTDTEMTSSEVKSRVRKAAAKADHETLVKLLALKSIAPRIKTRSQEKIKMSQFECTSTYNSLLWSSTADHYADRHDDVLHCMRALLDDPRTSDVNGDELMEKVLDDPRDMGDVLDLVLARWPELCPYDHDDLDRLVKNAIKAKAPRVFECLINQPSYDINEGNDLGKRLIHQVLGFTSHYNRHFLPAVLAHPHFEFNLGRERTFMWTIPRYVDTRAHLAVADNFYTDGPLYYGNCPLDDKRRAVRDVRLLLQDNRVDLHTMKNCRVDEGYETVAWNWD